MGHKRHKLQDVDRFKCAKRVEPYVRQMAKERQLSTQIKDGTVPPKTAGREKGESRDRTRDALAQMAGMGHTEFHQFETINQENRLLAGAHRLEAVKLLGWAEIECVVANVDELHAELIEIDENLVRHDLSELEKDEQLLREKEIYEILNPETRKGATNQYTKVLKDTGSDSRMSSFSEDAAKKMGITPREVRRRIQTARYLTPETKEVVKHHNIGVKQSLYLSRIKNPSEQLSAAQKLAAHEIKSVEELQHMPKSREVIFSLRQQKAIPLNWGIGQIPLRQI